MIEVQGIPENATDTVLTMIFENPRYCGIADVKVAEVKRLEGGRALLTIKEVQRKNCFFVSHEYHIGQLHYPNSDALHSLPLPGRSTKTSDNISSS